MERQRQAPPVVLTAGLKLKFLDKVSTAPDLTHLDKVVAFRLIEYFNPKKGCAWPSYQRLASEVRADKRSVVRSIHRLDVGGWFVVQRGRGGDGNRYSPNLEVVTAQHPLRSNKMARGSDRTTPKVVTEQRQESSLTTVESEIGDRAAPIKRAARPIPTQGCIESSPSPAREVEPSEIVLPVDVVMDKWLPSAIERGWPQRSLMQWIRGAVGSTSAEFVDALLTLAEQKELADPIEFMREQVSARIYGGQDSATADFAVADAATKPSEDERIENDKLLFSNNPDGHGDDPDGIGPIPECLREANRAQA